MKNMTYSNCLAAMYRLRRFGIKLELDTIRHILAGLDKPQEHFQSIHIAGTNGKGSVAAMFSTILQHAGYTVGRYTSPHLERFNERICINNRPIDDDEVISLYKAVTASKPDSRQPTFFEFATAMALLEFSRRNVDWAIIETGMGGRLDATNIILPELSIITNISLEHKTYLGSTIAAIAGEKAGIIKPRTPVVTGVQQVSARNAILSKAAGLKAPVYLMGRDFRTRSHQDGSFSYYGPTRTLRHCVIGLQGHHQIANASLVLAGCELLRQTHSILISDHHIYSGLSQTCWPGRLEIASTHPFIILDGAHNLMAVHALATHLKTHFPKKAITLVAGILDDKPYRSILKILADVCERIIVTQPAIDRALPVTTLADEAVKLWPDVIVKPSVDQALKKAMEMNTLDQIICVAGSLYVVGEAKTTLSKIQAFCS